MQFTYPAIFNKPIIVTSFIPVAKYPRGRVRKKNNSVILVVIYRELTQQPKPHDWSVDCNFVHSIFHYDMNRMNLPRIFQPKLVRTRRPPALNRSHFFQIACILPRLHRNNLDCIDKLHYQFLCRDMSFQYRVHLVLWCSRKHLLKYW